MTKEYILTRESFAPIKGETYENIGGGKYICVDVGGFNGPLDALMRNIHSGWTFNAKGCGIYSDGRIDWDYSTGGFFQFGRD